ncbi:MAG: hypothetical protein ACRD37_02480, partial [Candidatus Acidiferrales bacterium]
MRIAGSVGMFLKPRFEVAVFFKDAVQGFTHDVGRGCVEEFGVTGEAVFQVLRHAKLDRFVLGCSGGAFRIAMGSLLSGCELHYDAWNVSVDVPGIRGPNIGSQSGVFSLAEVVPSTYLKPKSCHECPKKNAPRKMKNFYGWAGCNG